MFVYIGFAVGEVAEGRRFHEKAARLVRVAIPSIGFTLRGSFGS